MAVAILVVEDHVDSLSLLTRLLSGAGYDVTGVSTVAQATRAAQLARFDLAIIDVGLPDGDGCDLMHYLRAAYGQRGIAMTGFGMPDELLRYENADFDGHIIKPFEWADLLRLVMTLTDGKPPCPPAAHVVAPVPIGT